MPRNGRGTVVIPRYSHQEPSFRTKNTSLDRDSDNSWTQGHIPNRNPLKNITN